MTIELLSYPGVPNFRKVSRSLPLFRSAAWDYATEAQKEHILYETGITHRIDLRSELENVFSKVGVNTTSYSDTLALQLRLSDSLVAKKTVRQEHKSEKLKVAKPYIGDIVKYNVNFMGAKYRNKVVWERLSAWDKLKVVWWIITFRQKKITAHVNEKIIAPRGLIGMYKDFVDYSQDAISTALQLIVTCLEEGHAVQYNCRYGKDRTGLISALIKHVLGEPFESIKEDYEVSERGLSGIVPPITDQFTADGLPDEFAKTPGHVLDETWQYIEAGFGTIDSFLDHIGFTLDWRYRLVALNAQVP